MVAYPLDARTAVRVVFLALCLAAISLVWAMCARRALAAPEGTPPQPIVPAPAVGPCSLIQSDFRSGDPAHGSFEAVVLEGRNLVHYFHVNDGTAKPWTRARIISTQATGPGCIIQSDFLSGPEGSRHGNFEVVVPEGNNLAHYFYVNDGQPREWQRGRTITAQATGPGCIIQSDFMAGLEGSRHGNFEVIVPEGSNLAHYFYVNDGQPRAWQRGRTITAQATGPGCVIQSDFLSGPEGNRHGNFEVAALEGSHLVHYFYVNDSQPRVWQRARTISTQATGPAALIQSDFTVGDSTGHGDLQVLVPESGGLAHRYLVNDGLDHPWQLGGIVSSAAAGSGALIQSDFRAGDPSHGNFEAITAVADANGCNTAAPCVRHSFSIYDANSTPGTWQAGPIVAVTGRSQKICQLTGDLDRHWGWPTINQTTGNEIWGTDLGVPVLHNGLLYYFFGDTIDLQPKVGGSWDTDSYARSSDFTPEDCLTLGFVTSPDSSRFRALEIAGVGLGAFETPTGAFSAGGRLYVLAASQFDGISHSRSVLAYSKGDDRVFTYAGDLSASKFMNVSAAVVSRSQVADLPQGHDNGVLLWGAGPKYRASAVYLAFLPFNSIGLPLLGERRYFAGLDNSGKPRWQEGEHNAALLFNQPCRGELSVTWNPYLKQWLMLYLCEHEPGRGINYRSADKPWGPWSAPGNLFHPGVDGGYCHFIHSNWDVKACDDVHDPERERVWGGEYAPYVIAPLTTGNAEQTTIYYTMSTWNPYEVMLMRATLAVPARLSRVVRLYADALVTGWDNWSWDSRIDLASKVRAHSGATSIAVTLDDPFGALSLRTGQPLDAANLAAVSFWAFGGASGSTLRLTTQPSDTGPLSAGHVFTAPEGVWTRVIVPLGLLGDPAAIARVNVQGWSGTLQPTFFIDDMEIVSADAVEDAAPPVYMPVVQR